MSGRSALRNVSALLRVAARPLEVIGAVLLGSVAVGAAARPCGITVVDAGLVPDVANGFAAIEPSERVPVQLRC